MAAAELPGHFHDLPADLGFLRHQRLDDGRIQNVGGRSGAAGYTDQLLHLTEARLRFRALRAGENQLRVEIRDLLGDQRTRRALKQPGFLAERFDGALGSVDLLSQAGDFLVEPGGGSAGGLEFRFQLIDDVVLGDLVGDLRRPVGIFRRKSDGNHPRKPLPGNRQPGKELVDDDNPFPRALLGLRECSGRRFAEQGGRPFTRNIGAEIEHIVEEALRSERRIELGIVVQTKLLDHLFGEPARLDDFNLAFDRLGVDAAPGDEFLDIDHGSVARFDQDLRSGLVLPRNLKENDGGRDAEQHDGPGDHPLATPELSKEIPEIECPERSRAAGTAITRVGGPGPWVVLHEAVHEPSFRRTNGRSVKVAETKII